MSMTQYSQITGNDYSQIREREWSHQSEALETRQLQKAADRSPPAAAVSTRITSINRDTQAEVSPSNNL